MNDEVSPKVVVAPIFNIEGDFIKLDNQELAPVAKELVEQLFGAFGITARQRRNNAKADADALLIRTQADIQADSLKRRAENRAAIETIDHQTEVAARLLQLREDVQVDSLLRRAVARSLWEGIEHERNIEEIARRALPHLNNDAKPREISREWLGYFLNVARTSTDEEVREIWGRVLAAEANKRGSFGKSTMHTLATIDSADARAFASLVSFGWDEPHEHRPIITNYTEEVYRANGVTFDSLLHLDEIGLISFDAVGDYGIGFPFEQKARCRYHHRSFLVQPGPGQRHEVRTQKHGPIIPLGKVMLSRAGGEIARICDRKSLPNYPELVVAYWKTHHCTVEEESR